MEGVIMKFIITKESNGDIKGGKAVRNYLNELQEGRYTVNVEKYKKKRSLPQNSYYYGVIIPSVLDGLVDMGFNKHDLSNEVVHEMLKEKFLKHDLGNENGEFVTIVRSTKTLSTSEFMDYIAEIQQWSSSFLGIYIPEPNEQSELNFE